VIGRLVTPSGPAFNLIFVALPQLAFVGPEPDNYMFSNYTYVGWWIAMCNVGLIVLYKKRFIEPPRPGKGETTLSQNGHREIRSRAVAVLLILFLLSRS